VGQDSQGARVLIGGHEHLFVDLLGKALNRYDTLHVVGTYCHGRELIEQALLFKPQVMLLQPHLIGEPNGLQVAQELRGQVADLRIIFLLSRKDIFFLEFSQEQCPGCSALNRDTLHGIEDVRCAIECVAVGLTLWDQSLSKEPYAHRPLPANVANLTPRQSEILELMAQGQSNEAIAKRLGLSSKSVKCAVSLIYQKLGVDRSADRDGYPRIRAVLQYLQTHRSIDGYKP
jgi:DNA-binding NarL/FixJ family response regulator